MPVPLPAGQTPYVTADQLLSEMWPVGVNFASIPQGRTVTDAERYAAVTNVAAIGTTDADSICNQPLRATQTTEFFHGPGDGAARVTVQSGSGLGRIILQRLPVLAISSVRVSPNVYPRQWRDVPDGNFNPEYPALGLYGSIAPSAGGQGGQAILVQQGFITYPRNSKAIETGYTHGWPHCSLTAAASQGASEISVDDCTGWAVTTAAGTGAAGVIYDGGSQEPLFATAASVASGPGTVTLSAPLQSAHQPGVMVSSFPQNIIWASAMLAGAAALVRGAMATSTQTAPGRGSSSAGRVAALRKEAAAMLAGYGRVL